MDMSNVLKTLQDSLELITELERAYVDSIEQSLGERGKWIAKESLSSFDCCGCLSDYNFIKERIEEEKNKEEGE